MDGAATLLRCDRILANSAFTAEGQQAQSWRSRRITVAPYGIDLQCLTDRERDEWRALIDARHAIPTNAPVVGIMARFDPWKGIDVALQAMAPLLRSHPERRFLIVGGQYRHFHPGYGEILAALAEREGVRNQVVFAGFQMDVRPYLARMTVLVHASVQAEPFGLTIIEAMASGVPVVAARAGGAAEIIDEGVDGLFHTPGNQTELREALHTLLSDAALRDKYVRAGLRKVESRYRPQSMMRVIEGVYDELLGVGATASNRKGQPVVQAS
jgi:glycosyltransferase involved in cell wall biosynthesis